MIRRPLTSFWLFLSQPKKRSSLRITQLSCLNEYKIEDMMVIVKRESPDWTRSVAFAGFVQRKPRIFKGYALFGNPRVIKTQGTDPRARGEFRRYLSYGKKEERKKIRIKLDLIERKDEYFSRNRSALVCSR